VPNRSVFSIWRLTLVMVVVAGGCDRTPPDVREWKATDHDRADEKGTSRSAPSRAQPNGSANPNTILVDVTWRTQCTPCHGLLGRGDGPQGPMVRAPDLTAADWQAKVSDQQIAATILNGKNKMPRFDLPADVVTGLVTRIRAAQQGKSMPGTKSAGAH
jgi:Cytochrome C oxidase, cbb3-type, subunit III